MRTILAFAIAPSIPAIIMCITDVPSSFYFAYSYIASCLPGIPAFLILKKKNKESHLAYAVTGFASGALLMMLMNIMHLFNPGMIKAALVFGVCGAMVALLFSVIRGPERRLPKKAAEDSTTT